MAYAGEFSVSSREELEKKGWLTCEGQDIPAGYVQLKKVLNEKYSNGKLPDLRGRALIGSGKGEKLTERTIGEKIGEEKHTLDIMEMPVHKHETTMSTIQHFGVGSISPTGGATGHYPNRGDLTSPAGAGRPHNNMQPSLVLNFIIKAK